MTRRLVLVGGGHAHLHVLHQLARKPMADVDVALVAPAKHLYAAMIPGFIQDRYDVGDLRFDLEMLARCAGARHVDAIADRVDVAERVVFTDGERVEFDVCSLDVGSDPAGARVTGMMEQALALRPPARAIELRERLDAVIETATRRLMVAVVGGGATGVQLAFAIQRRLERAPHGGMVSIVERARDVLGDFAPEVRRLATRLLKERRIGLVLGARVTRVNPASVTLDAGATVPADLVVWAAGASAPAVLTWSDVPKDDDGYLLVDDTLRAVDGSPVYGAGECVSLRNHSDIARSRVDVMYEASILDCNLRAALGQGKPKKHVPRLQTGGILDTADDKAILCWRKLHLHSRWARRMKDRRDRKFVETYQRCDETSRPAS